MEKKIRRLIEKYELEMYKKKDALEHASGISRQVLLIEIDVLKQLIEELKDILPK